MGKRKYEHWGCVPMMLKQIKKSQVLRGLSEPVIIIIGDDITVEFEEELSQQQQEALDSIVSSLSCAYDEEACPWNCMGD